MTVIVKHNKTNAISDWTQAQLDEQIALGNFASGTLLADIVLPSDWNNDHTLTGVVDIANGGTGATTSTGAINALLPTQTSNTGKVLTTDGTNTSWTANGNGTVTSVSGTGTVSGISLSGTVTSSGSLTLGGTLSLASPPTIGNTTPNTGAFTSVTTPSVTATTTDLTLSAISTGAVNLTTAGGTQFQIANTASATNYLATTGSNGGTPALYSAGASTNIGTNIVSKGTGAVAFYTNGGVVQQVVSHTASAVNYVQVTGSATGGNPVISVQGSDASRGLVLTSKGQANVLFNSSNNTYTQFLVNGANSAVNYHQVAGSVAGQAPIYSVLGTDTNISMAFQPKGTGAIDLAAGSSGVNISNGGTVTAITRTATGSAYTSAPTCTVSAPTTAGGVQATATSLMGINVLGIVSGGTGYTVGDTLTLVGGTGTVATLTVSTVSSGVITAVTVGSFGSYSVVPTNPISVTGGTGSSATFTSTWAVGAVSVATAGSGYIEQPTITFSGGGGSGAAAYARVGSGTVFRTLGSNVGFYTPGGPAFEVGDLGATTTDYISILGSQSAGYLGLAGSSTNSNLFLSTKGTGGIGFFTNGQGSTRQFSVNHTASAVNYVQVTGSATGGTPTISAQGSDANVILSLVSKGSNGIVLQTRGGGTQRTALQLIDNGAASINFLQVQSNITANAPSLSSQGSDTNIDLALTPKGTGLVRFGTYTGTILTPTGYVEIKTSDGTIRRLLVG